MRSALLAWKDVAGGFWLHRRTPFRTSRACHCRLNEVHYPYAQSRYNDIYLYIYAALHENIFLHVQWEPVPAGHDRRRRCSHLTQNATTTTG
jgi:hypothetical protein